MRPIIRSCLLIATLGIALGSLPACKDDNGPLPERKACTNCGTVETIASREVKGEATAAGTIAGAVAGAVIGHQFGGNSRSRDMATGAGAVGGAFAGRELEKQAKKHVVYDITVRMADGTRRTLTKPSDLNLREGDRVEVSGSEILRS
jgi:outer membrane lipoprotein SlyB